MTRSSLIYIAFLTLLIALPAPAARAPDAHSAATPAEATATFFSALAANDLDRAVALTAPVSGLPSGTVREFYARLARRAGDARREVVAHLRLDDTAVVVFREFGPGKSSRIDLDPAYLVRRDSTWLVLFKLTQFDRTGLAIDPETRTRFEKLQTWFRSQKPALQSLLRET